MVGSTLCEIGIGLDLRTLLHAGSPAEPPVNEPRRRRKDERRRGTPGLSVKSFAKALELVI